MKFRRVIFLDMDGVMNNQPFIVRMEGEKGGMDFIDPATVVRLNRIVAATGAVVVISSSWRGQYDFQQRLDEHGFKGVVVGETPRLSFHGRRRGHEIAKWLEDNGPVESFVILDDDSDMEHLFPRLVKTSFWRGLLDEHVEPAIKMLTEGLDPKSFPANEFAGWSAKDYVQLFCLHQVSDETDLEPVCREIVDAHPAEAAKFRSGKRNLMGFFIARVMARTRNGANPELTTKVLTRLLDQE